MSVSQKDLDEKTWHHDGKDDTSSKHCAGQMSFGQMVFDQNVQDHARQHLTSLKRCVGQMVIDSKTWKNARRLYSSSMTLQTSMLRCFHEPNLT
jgi:hypothetical protein